MRSTIGGYLSLVNSTSSQSPKSTTIESFSFNSSDIEENEPASEDENDNHPNSKSKYVTIFMCSKEAIHSKAAAATWLSPPACLLAARLPVSEAFMK